jgi:hypothetical protein
LQIPIRSLSWAQALGVCLHRGQWFDLVFRLLQLLIAPQELQEWEAAAAYSHATLKHYTKLCAIFVSSERLYSYVYIRHT